MSIICGDCLSVMRGMEPNSVDAIVTDPPYGLKFMGKDWDHGIPGVPFWEAALRVARPGCHLLAFGGTRTFHRLTCAIEDAGWEIRDTLGWVYGSGFPKSHDVSKAIDKAAGAYVPGPVSPNSRSAGPSPSGCYSEGVQTKTIPNPQTDAARQWDGWGTALKPAWEPIVLARKPLDGTVAANVQKWGTGAINIDASRIPTNGDKPTGSGRPVRDADPKAIQPGRSGGNGGNETPPQGRWPANLIHDGSDEVVELFPVTGASKATNRGLQHSGRHGGLADIGSNIKEGTDTVRGHNDNGGSAARFFYCAKASKKDRGEDNKHPTVKPTDLMRYLCRLVTPPNGLILDPFMGSGTTGMAAKAEGFRFIGIEKEQEYCEIAERRISAQ